ncbi:MAG: tRNA pseudouridine(55) synthase TruB [Anaerolineae bacterium]
MSDCANCPQAQTRSGTAWTAPPREDPLSGILNVDKPPDMTSHDVVDVIRRIVGQRRVGHAGTLDPMATGVLLVCLGQATRMSQYLMAGRKRYRATIVLGATTDTYDADGEVVTTGQRSDFTRDEMGTALQGFVGRISQVPPMYSAIKKDGKPLYQLARQGKTVEREPRTVEIDEISLLDWAAPALIIEVGCSPGTYIRSLAHDLGRALGTGAYLASLVRLQSGRFRLEDAVSLSRLEEAFRNGQEMEYVLPPDEALLEWPAMVVGAEGARRISHGQSVPCRSLAGADLGERCRAYSADGEFLAIMSYDKALDRWRPTKVFAPAGSTSE